MKSTTRTDLFALLALVLVASPCFAAEMILYDQQGLRGQQVVARDEVRNFSFGNFNDRVRSIVIRDGTWEVCADADFQGQCTRLGPGEYPELDRSLDRRISSVRPLSQRGDERGRRQAVARATLYEGPNFGGRSFPIGREAVGNLGPTGFNDRAQSLRVSEGYWIFCSDANFQGQCRTFGPGDYAALEGDLNGKISSGRMVSDNYPYERAPSWDHRPPQAGPSSRNAAQFDARVVDACMNVLNDRIRRERRGIEDVSTNPDSLRERQVSNAEFGISGTGTMTITDGFSRAFTFDCIVNGRSGAITQANYR